MWKMSLHVTGACPSRVSECGRQPVDTAHCQGVTPQGLVLIPISRGFAF